MVTKPVSKSRTEIKAADFINYSMEYGKGYTNLTAANVVGFQKLIGLKVKDKNGKFFGIIIGVDKDIEKRKLYGVVIERKSDKANL